MYQAVEGLNQMDQGLNQMDQSIESPSAETGREYGVVKAWIEERGMGFITSPSGLDHFVHRSMLTDGQSLTIGSTVSYVPGWDQLKNKAIAQQVQGAAPAAASAQTWAEPWAASPTASPQTWAATSPPNATQPWAPSPQGGESVGQVKAWIEARGMGFITPQDGSEDHFVHRSNLLDGQTLIVGQTVYYEPSWDAMKNKPCALKVTGAVQAGPAAVVTSPDNLFITGLPGDMTDDGLWATFGQYGQVVQCKLMPENGTPTRVALVRFAEASQAEWIVQNLNGNVPQGLTNPIGVKYHETKGGGKGGKDGGYGPATMKGAPASPYGNGKGWSQPPPPPGLPSYLAGPVKKDKLRVTGLPPGTDHQGIRDIMSQYGTVNHVFLKPDGAVIVHMSDEETAQWIVENLNGNIPQGLETPVNVSFEGGAPPQSAAPGGFITGTVKHWVAERGMGFLAPDGGGEDCFVHQTNLIDGIGLVVGAPVQFMKDWDYQKNKPVAIHVSGAVGGDGVGKGATRFLEAKGKGKIPAA
jgi:cold shock CspA family protein